ncbi:MAG: hypothetical protein AAB510_02980 [Patescibacteria group bacterium]
MEKLSWTALEYEDKERSRDWFWALGVIVFTASATAIIFGNYFFAALIVIGGGLLGFLATKKPGRVSYELNEKGLKIENNLFVYENLKSFWVQKENHDPHMTHPLLFIKSQRIFMPTITVPIDSDEHGEEVRAIFLHKGVEEEEMQERFSMKIMDVLGF